MAEEHNYTEDELAMLDEHERAAIEGDTVDDDDNDQLDNELDNELDEEQEQDPEQEQQQEQQQQQEEDPAKAEQEQQQAPTDDPASQEQEQEAEDPEAELKAKLADVNDQMDELGRQFEDGEIGFADYHKQLNELNNQRFEASNHLNRLHVTQEVRQQENSRQYESAKQRFLSQEGNNVFTENEFVAGAMVTAMRKSLAKPDAATKGYDWVFEDAKQQLVKANIIQAPTAKVDDPSKPGNRRPARESGIDKVPPTLGDLPLSKANEGNEFGHLDNLEGVELEEALARMPKDQEEKYLRG